MSKESMVLELDGSINIVNLDENGNEVSREALDGEVCLKAIMHVLEEAIMNYDDADVKNLKEDVETVKDE